MHGIKSSIHPSNSRVCGSGVKMAFMPLNSTQLTGEVVGILPPLYSVTPPQLAKYLMEASLIAPLTLTLREEVGISPVSSILFTIHTHHVLQPLQG